MYKDVIALALANVWSTPDASNQYIVKPRRITPDNGVLVSHTVKWDTYSLPNKTDRWHLYMVGSMHPTRLRLMGSDARNTWFTISAAMNASRTMVNIYNNDGIEIPRFETYYMYTKDGNLLLAVKYNPYIEVDFNEDIYFRFYQNAYFNSQDAASGATLTTFGAVMTSQADVAAMNAQIDAIRNDPGYTGGLMLFINGWRRTLSQVTANVGDYVEYVYDASIYKVVDFKISALASFMSTRDAKRKLLLHYPGGWGGKVDFQSNVDVYMVDSGQAKGVYVHKNAADMLRSVTYKDYAIAAPYLGAFYDRFYDANGNFTYDNMYLRVAIRYDGISQVPTEDANRQHYLLRLSNADQIRALVGLDANIPTWNAANLEDSAYVHLMESAIDEVTQDMAERALGYSVVNYSIAKNVQVGTPSGGGGDIDLPGGGMDLPGGGAGGMDLPGGGAGGNSYTFTVPRAFQYGATAYEYEGGKLTGWYPVASGTTTYTSHSSLADIVEFIAGEGGYSLDEVAGRVNFPIEAPKNYRFYMRKIINGVLQPNWTDVTNDPSEHHIVNGMARWVTTGNPRRIARSDAKHLVYSVDLVSTDGVLQHTLTYTNASGVEVTLPVPLGELDVWINGSCAVEGVDYHYDFPTITIISKELLVRPVTDPQRLTVRMTGFCREDLSSYKIEETGFIWDGVMSVDGRFDPNYLKSMRVTIGGLMVEQSNAPYVEDQSSGSLSNGKPYALREFPNHLNGFISRDPRTYYDEAVAVDEQIAGYLTLKLGQTTGPINPIEPRYQLYSPFICKVMYALKNGTIPESAISGSYSDELVVQLVTPYLYLIDSDPIKEANRPDMRYCVIMPNWLDDYFCLSEIGLKFLYNVVRIYAQNLVDLSGSLYICGFDPPGGGLDLPPDTGGGLDLPPGG